MCANDRPPDPSKARLNSRLFDSEAESDVVFLVGSEAESSWRFPGHRSVLSERNPVFKAMLGSFPTEDTVLVKDVDGRAFDLLLRYLYKEDVRLQSVGTALSTLYAAQKYLCPGLMRHCLLYLDSQLSTSNALQVFEHLRVYAGQQGGAYTSPSAPPLEHLLAPGVASREEDEFTASLGILRSLLFNTLLFIDVHAEEIMSGESAEDLRADSLRELLERDTLSASELVLYSLIERWSNRECKRCHLELSHENRRAVLGEEILFAVRYLLMSEKEFCCGPLHGGLLSKTEGETLLCCIQGARPVSNSCPTLGEVRLAGLRVRRSPPRFEPLPLGKKARKRSDEKKKKKKKDKIDKEKGSCSGSCVADYVLRALACLFD